MPGEPLPGAGKAPGPSTGIQCVRHLPPRLFLDIPLLRLGGGGVAAGKKLPASSIQVQVRDAHARMGIQQGPLHCSREQTGGAGAEGAQCSLPGCLEQDVLK